MKFELTEYKAADKAISPEIVQAVDALIDATATNENAAITVVFDIADEAKELRAFRQAAKDKGKTVRVRTRDDSALTRTGQKDNGKAIYTGEVTLVLSITEKYKDGRGRKPAADKGETPAEKSGK